MGMGCGLRCASIDVENLVIYALSRLIPLGIHDSRRSLVAINDSPLSSLPNVLLSVDNVRLNMHNGESVCRSWIKGSLS